MPFQDNPGASTKNLIQPNRLISLKYLQAAQKVPDARPRERGNRSALLLYVRISERLRTKQGDCFSSLLDFERNRHEGHNEEDDRSPPDQLMLQIERHIFVDRRWVMKAQE